MSPSKRYSPRTKPGVAGFNYLLHVYKKNARKRGLDWKLTKPQFRKLTKSNCFYCGAEPAGVSTHYRKATGDIAKEHTAYIYNGVDRINPADPYTTENCVPACSTCNYIKLDYSTEELFTHIRKMLAHFDRLKS